MENMYACLVLHSVGMPITEDSLEKVLMAVGVEPNMQKLQALVAALIDIDIDEVISKPPAPVLVEPEAEVPTPKPKDVEPEMDDMGLGMLFGKPPKKKEEEEEMTGLGALFGK